MNEKTGLRVATLALTTTATIITASSPAAAQQDLECDTPSSFDPLLGLLDSVTQLAFLGGVGLATLGFLVAGLFLMLPGQDSSRRGKLVAKNVFIGAVLLLSAHMIVDFLVSELGVALCT